MRNKIRDVLFSVAVVLIFLGISTIGRSGIVIATGSACPDTCRHSNGTGECLDFGQGGGSPSGCMCENHVTNKLEGACS
jgi:hypothetical protein